MHISRKSGSALLFLFASLSVVIGQNGDHLPSFEEVISLPSVRGPLISPDGRHTLFTVSRPDWNANRMDSEIWIARNNAAPFQLTRTDDGGSFDYKWSPDGKWISFKARRGEHTQIHVIRLSGGEAMPVTHVNKDIGQYAWSPDGSQIAFTMQWEDKPDTEKRSERYGEYATDDEEFVLSGLYVLPFDPDTPDPSDLPCHETSDSLKKLNCIQYPEPTAIIDSVDFTVSGFEWSPDGSRICFNKRRDPLINSWFYTDIAIVDVQTREISELVANPSADACIAWSPDGQYILYGSDVDNFESAYYTNNRLFIVPSSGGESREVAAQFDEDKSVLDWNPAGIFFVAFQKTYRRLYRLDPSTGEIFEVLSNPDLVYDASFSDNGTIAAISGRMHDGVVEIFRYNFSASPAMVQLTNEASRIENWKTSDSEVISWESEDGTIIEGILHKPADYDPERKYPLLVIIHGGPTGISLPAPVVSYVYPVLQWLDKGALVLQPNYRGSAGYGRDFRKLNVRNLGVGDMWDVMSGIDYLDSQGLIDTDSMGCMGWSQGGYISAFLTTNTDRFKAISVGAGISNWMTYYVNTDIHPFTRQYLKATPWEDEEIYKITSPMTNINNASTPTLIQHGEFDRRVPIANAYELLQGLRDVGVDSRLIVYKGFGHGINKPKERLAATWHNWQWFNKYLWGEETDLPME